MNRRWRASAGIAMGMLSLASAVSAQAPARELRDVARQPVPQPALGPGSPVPPPVPPAARGETGLDDVGVRVHLYADRRVDETLLRRAQSDAGSLLSSAGVTNAWRICNAPDACAPAGSPRGRPDRRHPFLEGPAEWARELRHGRPRHHRSRGLRGDLRPVCGRGRVSSLAASGRARSSPPPHAQARGSRRGSGGTRNRSLARPASRANRPHARHPGSRRHRGAQARTARVQPAGGRAHRIGSQRTDTDARAARCRRAVRTHGGRIAPLA